MLFSYFFYSSAVAGERQNPAGKLIVGIKETPPFSMKNAEGQRQDISIKLWEPIAKERCLAILAVLWRKSL
jgi:hypothetical protein